MRDLFTKAQAAAALGCSTKTIEALVKRKVLQQVSEKSPDTGAIVAMYYRDDVLAERTRRYPDAAPFVLAPAAGNGFAPLPGDITIVPAAGGVERMTALLEALGPLAPPSVRVPEKIFLTLDEATAYSGLPYTEIRRLMTSGALPARKLGGGWRIKRVDLEALT
jgi:excisionase family DNA binding protein